MSRRLLTWAAAASLVLVVSSCATRPRDQPANGASGSVSPTASASATTASAASEGPTDRQATPDPRASGLPGVRHTRPFPFEPQLEAYLARRSGAVSVAVHVPGTDRTYLYTRGPAGTYTASIVKVDVLALLLTTARREGRDLTATERGLAESMITSSDNLSTRTLWRQLGGAPALKSLNDRLGMTQTVPGEGGYWGHTRTTALDQVRLLDHLVRPNTVLTAAERISILSLMHEVVADQDWGVTAGPPRGTVAVKNGWRPDPDGWRVNSIGSVSAPGTGGSYLIAVLTQKTSKDFATQIATVEGVSRLVWTHRAQL